MAIPDYQSIMLPFLTLLADGCIRTMREIRDELSNRLKLTDSELAQMLPSGQQPVFSNRVAWAKVYLEKAELIESPKRGVAVITQLGLKVLSENPTTIDNEFLRRFQAFNEFASGRDRKATSVHEGQCESLPPVVTTPSESIQIAYSQLQDAVAEELLSRLKSCSPSYFEIIMVRLLRAMGYGGVAGDGEVMGRPGDGGIDGIIKEDKLGLDVVCIQAKRWENSVGRPVVQAFVGSMDFYRARKGVIMTTSYFSRDAIDYVERIEGKKVVLIDGEMLCKLMIGHNVGVATKQVYELKEVSNDFFDEDLA